MLRSSTTTTRQDYAVRVRKLLSRIILAQDRVPSSTGRLLIHDLGIIEDYCEYHPDWIHICLQLIILAIVGYSQLIGTLCALCIVLLPTIFLYAQFARMYRKQESQETDYFYKDLQKVQPEAYQSYQWIWWWTLLVCGQMFMLLTTTLAYLSPDSSLLATLWVLDRLDVLVHQGMYSLKDHLRYKQAVTHVNDFILCVPPPAPTTEFPPPADDDEPMPLFLLPMKQSLIWTKTTMVLALVATHMIILNVRRNLFFLFLFQIIGAILLSGLNGLKVYLDAEKKIMEQHTIRARLIECTTNNNGALAVTLLNPLQNRSFLAHMVDHGEMTDFQTYRKTVRAIDSRTETILSIGSTIIMVLFPNLVVSGLLLLLSLIRREYLVLK
jgi:hypothetical protein